MAKTDLSYWESWFKIENYTKLNTLDLRGWEGNLSIRLDMKNNKEIAKAWLEDLKTDPVFDYGAPFAKADYDGSSRFRGVATTCSIR